MQWKAYKNYKSAEKQTVVKSATQSTDVHAAIPSAQIHGKPIKWDRIARFSRAQGPKRRRRTGFAPIGEKIQLDLRLDSLRPTVNTKERILLLTKSYLDWNISSWYPLGFAKHPPRHRLSQNLGHQDYEQGEDGHGANEGVSRLFNKCFYNAIPLLLTNRTPEAFKEISLACSLASHCLQHSPYWVFLRLLRLYSYPLWGRFPDVRRQIVTFLQALAARTLPKGHALRPLLHLWAQEDAGFETGGIASLLRLSSDTFGPSSGLDTEEWAWIQDEICSLSYQRRELHDALRIARRLADDPNVPHGVQITSQQMIARYHLHHGNVDEAEVILLGTIKLCAACDTQDEQARFFQQTFSDLGYISHVRQDRVRSLSYYESALKNATQVQNIANMSSINCRVEALAEQTEQNGKGAGTGRDGRSHAQHDSSWAMWAFCRPHS